MGLYHYSSFLGFLLCTALPAMDFLWCASLPMTTLLLITSHLYQHFLVSCFLHSGYLFFHFSSLSLSGLLVTQEWPQYFPSWFWSHHSLTIVLLTQWTLSEELIIVIHKLLPIFFFLRALWWVEKIAPLKHQMYAESGHERSFPDNHWLGIQRIFFWHHSLHSSPKEFTLCRVPSGSC